MKLIDLLLTFVGIIMMVLGLLHLNDWHYSSTIFICGLVIYVNSKISLVRQQ